MSIMQRQPKHVRAQQSRATPASQPRAGPGASQSASHWRAMQFGAHVAHASERLGIALLPILAELTKPATLQAAAPPAATVKFLANLAVRLTVGGTGVLVRVLTGDG